VKRTIIALTDTLEDGSKKVHKCSHNVSFSTSESVEMHIRTFQFQTEKVTISDALPLEATNPASSSQL